MSDHSRRRTKDKLMATYKGAFPTWKTSSLTLTLPSLVSKNLARDSLTPIVASAFTNSGQRHTMATEALNFGCARILTLDGQETTLADSIQTRQSSPMPVTTSWSLRSQSPPITDYNFVLDMLHTKAMRTRTRSNGGLWSDNSCRLATMTQASCCCSTPTLLSAKSQRKESVTMQLLLKTPMVAFYVNSHYILDFGYQQRLLVATLVRAILGTAQLPRRYPAIGWTTLPSPWTGKAFESCPTQCLHSMSRNPTLTMWPLWSTSCPQCPRDARQGTPLPNPGSTGKQWDPVETGLYGIKSSPAWPSRPGTLTSTLIGISAMDNFYNA